MLNSVFRYFDLQFKIQSVIPQELAANQPTLLCCLNIWPRLRELSLNLCCAVISIPELGSTGYRLLPAVSYSDSLSA